MDKVKAWGFNDCPTLCINLNVQASQSDTNGGMTQICSHVPWTKINHGPTTRNWTILRETSVDTETACSHQKTHVNFNREKWCLQWFSFQWLLLLERQIVAWCFVLERLQHSLFYSPSVCQFVPESFCWGSRDHVAPKSLDPLNHCFEPTTVL